MSPLIDFHSHFFSRPFFDALAAASPLPGDPEKKLTTAAAQAGIELPSTDLEEHLGRWLQQMDAFGVAHMVTFASLPEEIPAVAEAAALANGRITPFALVNPTVEGAAKKVHGLFTERGFRGILLFPAMHRFDIAGKAAREVLGVVHERGAVAVVHCGMLQVKLRDVLGLPRPYDLSLANPLALIPAANAFPSARFVIPHFGAGFLRETLMAGTMCSNVFVDTSSSNGWMTTQPGKLTLVDVFEQALAVFGADRILFGTDSSTFPRGWRQDLLRAQREALGACGVSEEDRNLVLGGNARRLLGLA